MTGDCKKAHIWTIWAASLLVLMLLPALVSGCSSDCSWGTKAQAFVDENLNGRWDEGESPLSGVKFFVVDAQGNSGYGGGWESDRSGNAFIGFLTSCNESADYILSAATPEGFMLTTPQRVEAGSESAKTFTFGFAKRK